MALTHHLRPGMLGFVSSRVFMLMIDEGEGCVLPTPENESRMGVDDLKRLRAFVLRSLRPARLTDYDDIFEVGGATSLFAMELVLFIEETLGLVLEDEDLERDNFSSIAALAAMVARKRDESG